MIEKEVTWDLLEHACKKLARDIKASKLKITTLVAIARGGLFIAAHLGHLLNINDIRSVCMKSYEGKEQGKLECLFLPDFNPRTSLVVDDLVDTGNTMDYLEKLKNQKLYSAVLYCKKKSSYVPTFAAEELEKNCWVIFPWEQSKLNKKWEENV